MPWHQHYTPTGGLFSSAALASLPVVVLLALLAGWHVRAQWAALAGLACAFAIALGVYRMPPALAGLAALQGAAFGLFPIGWIVLNAIFIYDLSVATGQFAVLQGQVAGLARDRRLQALLIAYCFGSFIEGCAGFGAPVAITGALMIGLGFPPLEAATLALIGNTAPVAFGSIGIPVVTLAQVTGLDLHLLSAMAGRQLPIFAAAIPFWLVAVQAGWRGMLGVWPACLVTGVTFGTVQFLVSNFHGPWLVDLAASLASFAALLLLLSRWHPAGDTRPPPPTERRSRRAWIPWLSLTVFVFAWSQPSLKKALDAAWSLKWAVPMLNGGIVRVPPAVPVELPEPAIFNLNLLSATGTALLLAGVVAGLLLGVRPLALARIYGRTVFRVRASLATIATMLALGFTTRFSGSDTTLGLAFASTGGVFPFFSPLLGWLGVALTGSDTSSNVLFGNLQQVTAGQLGLPPILTAAANTSGGVMGKMIDAQSIVVASVAVGGPERGVHAGEILRRVAWHSLALAVLMGVWVSMLAWFFPRLIPS